MKRDYEQILSQLPKDWSELRYYQYKQIALVKEVESDEVDNDFIGQENTLRVLGVLTGIPVDELRETPYSIIIPMANRIAFTQHKPEYDKHSSKIKWKKIDNVSYDAFTTFLLLSADPMKNIATIIKSFSVDKISDEEIDQISMLEVYSSFFTLRRYVDRFMRRMYTHLVWKLLRQTLIQKLKSPIKVKLKGAGSN